MADEKDDDTSAKKQEANKRGLDTLVECMEKLQVNAQLNLEAIMACSGAEMAEQCMTRFAEVCRVQALVLYTVTMTCPSCPRNPENPLEKAGRCKLCDIIQMTGMLSTYAVSSVAGAMAKWNALHPNEKPLGNAKNLATVAEALNKQAN